MAHLIRIFLIASLLTMFSEQSIAKTFKIATLAPAGTAWMKEMKKGAGYIEEKTEGRVKLKFYPGGVMGNEQSVHRKIKVGQLHGGAFSSGGLAHLYPDIQTLNLPMLFNSFDEVDYVRGKMDAALKQNMEQNGFVLLGIAEGGFSRILSKKPMRDLASIRASKLWVPEGDVMVQETYDTMGLSPIPLPVADVFTGLQTGLVETVTITSSGAIAFQWHSSTAYITDTPLIYLVGLLVVQKQAFDKISPGDQAIIKQEMAIVVEQMDKLTREDNLKAIDALKKQGIIFVKPELEELDRWKNLAARSIDNLIAKGALSQAGVDEVMKHLNDYRNSRLSSIKNSKMSAE
jgi:TRAP-type C4-dicarboxylate transport system substrate-binding protein